MKRKEFIKLCSILGVGAPFSTDLIARGSNDNHRSTVPLSQGKVLIIGAGPAGMSAGYLLEQVGIDYQILEALPTHGGRIKHNTTFSNFPISLGGEWMHVANSGNKILAEIVNTPSTKVAVRTKGYNLQADSSGYFDGRNLSLDTLGNHFGYDFVDKKFVGSSWLNFFESYILPSIQTKIKYNTPVAAIDYATNNVAVTSVSGEAFAADKVIVTVPLKILQNGTINFKPHLPAKKRKAIAGVKVWSGFKAFFKFSSKFYPTYLSFPNSAAPEGQWQYYDAAYAQQTSDNILGLFSTGQPAEVYQQYAGDDQRDYILNELDNIFGDSVASSSYIDHIVQDWNKAPYANGAYATAYEDYRQIGVLGESIGNKLYFAGDAYTTGRDWSSVHAAARSARRAVEELVG